MRFFIALDIPEQSRVQIQGIQTKLKQLIPSVHLTDSDKLHLTIAFVGDQPEVLKDKLALALHQDVQNISPFVVTPAYIDAFPKLHHPNTFWVGVKGDVDKLLLLRERIKDSLMALNLDVDARRFVPHIAIAKVSDFELNSIQEEAIVGFFNQPIDPITIQSVKLFESVPDKGFHIHNTLAEIKLEN